LLLLPPRDNAEVMGQVTIRALTGADRPWADRLRGEDSRKTLKPSISEVGSFGIPIRDEIVLKRRRH
jgi:hypothetical protein